MNRIYFTADLHFGHPKKQQESPPYDERLLDLWRRSVDSRDTVYILGDVTFLPTPEAIELLEKLPGKKILIAGNHDDDILCCTEHFDEICQIKEVRFTPSEAPFLKRSIRLVMCHYPMLTWNHKQSGALMLHGHSHGRLDKNNALSVDLRFDVGLDSKLADHRLLSLEDIYVAATKKILRRGCRSIKEYAKKYYLMDKKDTISES
jgi:calcineurin-like phosphoesterase family protein